jgi:hypothetical protein
VIWGTPVGLGVFWGGFPQKSDSHREANSNHRSGRREHLPFLKMMRK